MVEKVVTVINEHGIHARPASMLVETAGKYQSSVTLENGGVLGDAKSIMGIMMLAAVHGTQITVRCEGSDESEALAAVSDLFESRFGQES